MSDSLFAPGVDRGIVDAYLVYDGDCRLCALAKDLVKALDVRGRILPVALQDQESARLLSAMDEARRGRSFHFVRNGVVSSRGDGVIGILGLLPMGAGIPGLAAEVPVVRRAGERAYALLHGIRDRLHCAT